MRSRASVSIAAVPLKKRTADLTDRGPQEQDPTAPIFHKFCASNYWPNHLSIQPCTREMHDATGLYQPLE
jgi:hypothetical protein